MIRKAIVSAKQALMLLSDTEEVLPEVDNIAVEDLVVLGQRLWWLVKRTNRVLDAIKIRLRDAASGHTGDTWRCESPDGSHCLVIPNSATLNVRKDADIKGLRTLLGDHFPEFFREVVTYQPQRNFQIRTAQCKTDVQVALLGSVDMTDRTPRVVFKD